MRHGAGKHMNHQDQRLRIRAEQAGRLRRIRDMLAEAEKGRIDQLQQLGAHGQILADDRPDLSIEAVGLCNP